ncbi:sensor domain-containing diguanylate cyclase [Clostridium botulinum]|uniref:sensor domain-containing diguanylate cyclase n=1 Tax=Clostridium botulinum TaxID=1491 RepID=UPI0004DA4DF3|nr:sensor domain-containing diguanylate cyclase [Clostridium botulinum]KEH94971.1 histidine kinase [Clostridium botulinum C/D str. It1]
MKFYQPDSKSNMEEEYNKLKEEFETYQNFAESTIQMITEKNIKIEKKLDAMINIVEISKYINVSLSNENLIPMINDMIIGILGATYSSIYIVEDEKLKIKATNIENLDYDFYSDEEYKELFNGKYFIINSKKPLVKKNVLKNDIHSLIGVPIYLREKFIGYIVVKHTLNNFFSHEHISFILTIANQIAIALENNSLYNKIRQIAIRDPLIGIYNRKHFFNIIEEKIKKDKASKRFAIVMMDIDDFKKVNDKYGHQVGDEVLKETGKIIVDNLNKEDIVARYGGEEIIMYVSNFSSKEDVYNIVNGIRKKISENIIKYEGMKVSITASFGIAYYMEDGKSLNSVISVADNRLYIAKKANKNVVIYK